MSNNISKDICEHYGVELPTDAFYKAGGMDFRNDCGEGSPMEILREVRSAVDAFVGDAEQFDDLTMMCLEYRGPHYL